MITKRCTKCGITKPLSDFNKHKTCRYGVRSQCKACDVAYSDKWKAENPEAARKHRSKNHQTHKSERLTYNKLWIASNPDKIKAQRQRYHSNHRDERVSRSRQRYATNKESHLEYMRRRYTENKEKIVAKIQEWRNKNPEKKLQYSHTRRAKIKGNGGTFTVQEWKELCSKYGNKCLVPGCDRTDLSPDHVIPISKGGTNSITNIQPLCSYHNNKKRAKIIDYR